MDFPQERAYPTPYANSSILPMLLLSFAMQKHTPSTKDKVQNSYDYIIVGAGAAGSVVASRLSELSCVTVLLLEAGKSPPKLTEVPSITRSFIQTDLDWNYRTAPQKKTGAGLNNRQLSWPSGKAVGGTSIFNGGLNVRGNRRNYDDWANGGATGWSYDEVLPYFKKLENDSVYFSQNPGFHGISGPVPMNKPRYFPAIQKAISDSATNLGYSFVDINGPTQAGFSDFTFTSTNGTRVSAAKAYLVPAEKRPNLDIVAETLVTKILIRNRTAVGVEIERNGKRLRVRARREVIVSAGTINTAQLLMLSGIGPKEHLRKMKIPLVANLPVGLNFQDHQGAILPYTVTDSLPQFIGKLLDNRNIDRYIRQKSGPLSSIEGVINMALLNKDRNAPPDAKPDYQLYFMEPQLETAKNQANLDPQGYKLVFGPFENKTSLWCVSQILNPRSRGSVTLSSADIHDPPIIDPNYYDVDEDITDVVEGMKKCNEILSQPPAQNLMVKPYDVILPGCEQFVNDIESYLRCQIQAVAVTLSHPVGTARMGNPYNKTSVVCPELRVLTLKSLRVVDASVMPIIPSGNTYIPTMMIAEKASDIIKRSITCTS